MIAKARFGRWHLPADWLQIRRSDGAISLAESFPARFSYDAVRVPLFLAWAGVAPEVVASVSNFWTGHCPGQPNWVDLKTDNPAGPLYLRGAQSIATFIGRVPVPSLHPRPLPVRPFQAVAAAPASDAAGDSYYSAALSMMTRLAHHAVSDRNAGNPVSS